MHAALSRLEASPFATARLAAGATALRNMIVDAQQDSAQTPVRYPPIRPATLLPTDQDAGLADIYCDRCVPPWRALQVDSKREPWRVSPGCVLACPGCRQRLQVRVRQLAWRPTYASRPEF
jgi:hypothetical protein